MHKNFATGPYPDLVNPSQPVSLNRLQSFGARINSRCNFQNSEIEITWFKFLVKTLHALPPPNKQTEWEKRKQERKKGKSKRKKSQQVCTRIEVADACAVVLDNSTLHPVMQHIHLLVPRG